MYLVNIFQPTGATIFREVMANVFKKQMMKATRSMYTDVSDKLKLTKNTAVAGSSARHHHYPCAQGKGHGKRASSMGKAVVSFIQLWALRCYSGASQVALVVRTRLPMQEAYQTQVRFLSQKDPLEEGTATHSRILAWRIPRPEESGRLQSMGSQTVGHD